MPPTELTLARGGGALLSRQLLRAELRQEGVTQAPKQSFLVLNDESRTGLFHGVPVPPPDRVQGVGRAHRQLHVDHAGHVAPPAGVTPCAGQPSVEPSAESGDPRRTCCSLRVPGCSV